MTKNLGFSFHGLPGILGFFIGSFLIAQGNEAPAQLKEKPITPAPGKVGDLLRQWWREGSAAGNGGDFYDNRDGGHSELNLGSYPQLQKIHYSPEDIKFRKHWAAQRVLLPHVVFGNSSTSAPPTQGGSNVRIYYTNPAGLQFLYKQYTQNNLYIYPEHRDHDPGHNGLGDGFGDLYPTNTPYLITSQGSSGSDQPFMRALPFTLAAFRPEVKKKLTETGLLMPTVQMIFRSTNKHLKDPGEYLTGKAHPSVFEGNWVNDLGMVQLAHDLRLDNLPPMIQLKVVQEDQALPGRDFFDVHPQEKLADTPAVIARIYRGKEGQRRLKITAADSFDLNKKNLTFTWVVLRGDPARIKIMPGNPDRSEAEIVVSYHERRPIAPGSAMESNRVDIGVFAHNGTYYSAPGFITFFSLDSEGRTYDDKDRIREIGYGMGQTTLKVTDWKKFFAALGEPLTQKLVNLKMEERKLIEEIEKPFTKLQEELAQARVGNSKVESYFKKAVDELEKKKLEEKLALGRKKITSLEQSINDLLDGKTKEFPQSVRVLSERYLHELIRRPDFLENPIVLEIFNRSGKPTGGPAYLAQQRMMALGLVEEISGPVPKVKAIRSAKDRTVFEQNQLERFHGVLLANRIFSGCVTASFQVNFVDQRLTAPRDWRDVYHYDDKGNYLGWTRYHGKETSDSPPEDFTPDGLLIVTKDTKGQPSKGRIVNYVQDPLKTFGLNNNPLRQVPGETITILKKDGQ